MSPVTCIIAHTHYISFSSCYCRAFTTACLSVAVFLLVFIFAQLYTAFHHHHSCLPSHTVQESSATSQYAHLNTLPLASVLHRRLLHHHDLCHRNSVLCFILLSGDIETNPGPVASHFNICTLSIQSLADHKSIPPLLSLTSLNN